MQHATAACNVQHATCNSGHYRRFHRAVTENCYNPRSHLLTCNAFAWPCVALWAYLRGPVEAVAVRRRLVLFSFTVSAVEALCSVHPCSAAHTKGWLGHSAKSCGCSHSVTAGRSRRAARCARTAGRRRTVSPEPTCAKADSTRSTLIADSTLSTLTADSTPNRLAVLASTSAVRVLYAMLTEPVRDHARSTAQPTALPSATAFG